MGETTELPELNQDRIFIRRGPFQLPEDDQVPELPAPVPTEEAEEGLTDYFSCYLSYISSLGCAPPMPEVRSKRKRLCKWVAFVMITVVAGYQSFSQIKWYLLSNSPKLKQVIEVVYALIKALLKVKYVYVVCCRREELKKLINRIYSSKRVFRRCFSKKKVKVICVVFLVAVISKTIAEETLHHQHAAEWTLKEAVLQRSFEMAYSMYVWKTEWNNATEEELEQINDLYATEITPTTIWFAATQFTTAVVGKAFEKAINIMFAAALTLNCLTYFLKLELHQEREIDNTDRQPTFPTNVWLMYKEIKEISAGMNDIFGDHFFLIHVENYLFGAKCLYRFTHGDISADSIFLLAIAMTIYSITYCLLAESSGMNLASRNWVQHHYSHVVSVWLETENRSLVISTLLDELQTSPLGLTINSTPVDSAFIVRLVGTIISSYMLLVGATDDAKRSNT